MKTKFSLKTSLFSLLLILAGTTVTFAQCDKTATLKSSTTSYVDDKGTVLRSKEEETTVTILRKDSSDRGKNCNALKM